MNVAIDTRHILAGVGTGGQRVLDNLMRALSVHAPDLVMQPYNAMADRLWTSTAWGRLLAAIWADAIFKNLLLPGWCRRHKPDVLLYALPPISFRVRNTPQVCYILDVPLETEERSIASTIYNNIYIKQSCLKADLILTISQDAAEQIVRRYRVSRHKIKVVYLCEDIKFIQQVPACAPLPGCDGFFVGIISRMNWRKNPAAYLEAFRRLPKASRARYPLLLLGAVRSLDDLRPFVSAEAIEDVREDVRCIGRVSDEQLIGYIKSARALLFPSNYEGFGLPVLEAVACGTPAVISNIPVFKELFSEVAHLYEPNDYQGMADRLSQILRDTPAPLCVEKVQSFLYRFTFNTHSERILEVLKQMNIKERREDYQ